MGRTPGGKDTKQKHAPLQTQLKEDLSGTLKDKSNGPGKKKHQKAQLGGPEGAQNEVVPAALSEKILRLAREQQAEDEDGAIQGYEHILA